MCYFGFVWFSVIDVMYIIVGFNVIDFECIG